MSRVYELIIRNETSEDVAEEVGGAGGIQTNDGAGSSPGGERTKQPRSEGMDASQALKKLFGYSQIKQVATQVVGFQVSTVQLRTGSHEAQQRATFGYNMAQKAVSLGESVAAGAMVGGPAGAAVALVMSLLNTVIGVSQKIEKLRIEQNLEDTSHNLSAQRATVSGSRYQNVTQG